MTSLTVTFNISGQGSHRKNLVSFSESLNRNTQTRTKRYVPGSGQFLGTDQSYENRTYSNRVVQRFLIWLFLDLTVIVYNLWATIKISKFFIKNFWPCGNYRIMILDFWKILSKIKKSRLLIWWFNCYFIYIMNIYYLFLSSDTSESDFE